MRILKPLFCSGVLASLAFETCAEAFAIIIGTKNAFTDDLDGEKMAAQIVEKAVNGNFEAGVRIA